MWSIGEEKPDSLGHLTQPIWMFVAMWYLFAAISFLTQQLLLASVFGKGAQTMQRKIWAYLALGQCNLLILISFFEFWLQPKVIESYVLGLGNGAGFPALTEFFFHVLPKGSLICTSTVLGIASVWSMVSCRAQKEIRIIHSVPFIAFSVFGLLFLVVVPIALVLPLLSV